MQSKKKNKVFLQLAEKPNGKKSPRKGFICTTCTRKRSITAKKQKAAREVHSSPLRFNMFSPIR